MSTKRKIEIFSAGCPLCQEAIATIKNNACASCDVSVLNINDPAVSGPESADREIHTAVDSEIASYYLKYY